MRPTHEGRSGATRAVSAGGLQALRAEIRPGAHGSFSVAMLCGDRAARHISPRVGQGDAVWHS